MLSKLKYIMALCFMTHGLWAFQSIIEQDSLPGRPYLSIDQSIIVSGRKALPYWFSANNSKRLDDSNYLGTWTSLSFLKHQKPSTLDYFYGLEVNAFAGNEAQASITQAYAGLESKYFRLSAGIQEEFFGINDSTLSIGNLFYSNNARPLPKVIFSTTDWLNAPFLKGVVSFKAYFAHGWFEKDRFQQKALLHHKYAYLKIKLLDSKLQLIAGLNHAAQWSGSNERTGQQPSTLSDFARIVIAKGGGAGADESDQLNALGNHLGSYDLSASLKLKKITIRNYWQFLWEDRSGLTPFNWRDGILGISVKSNSKKGLITGFNLEIIRTTHQDAFKTSELGDMFLEPDNFFNNTIYRSGWSYQDQILASPVFLILSPQDNSLNRVLGRVNGVNIALEGKYKQFDYRLQFRHFKNSGTFFEVFDPRLELTSIEGNVQVPIKNAYLRLRGIIELGNYPRNNAGLIITYMRNFNL